MAVPAGSRVLPRTLVAVKMSDAQRSELVGNGAAACEELDRAGDVELLPPVRREG